MLPQSQAAPQSIASPMLASGLRSTTYLVALINIVVGLLFFLAPETGWTPWPTPIAPVLCRFIGGIIVANGIGAWAAARAGTWEGARVLFLVALAYGLLVLVGLLYHAATGTLNPVLWTYIIVDLVFLGPIAGLFLAYDRAARHAGLQAPPSTGRAPAR